MASKYRYRMTQHGSRDVENIIDRGHVMSRLGRVCRVKAYRVTSNRDGLDTWREQLIVVGTEGTARFNGVCWGYGGQGPHAVRAVLRAAGVDHESADQLAFNGPRPDRDGMHWQWIAPTHA